ncbi:P-type conjugative transfer protein TrbJ [Escherichia coli]|nr:P-type conjugative transfer protein TrbJ [Escherichia coli]
MGMNLAAKFTLGVITLACIGFEQTALAGIPVADGLNLSQTTVAAYESVAQTLKQVESYGTQIQQYKTQLDQYENMIRNTVAPAAYIWDQAQNTINKVMAAQDMLNYYANSSGSVESYLSKFQSTGYYRSSPCFNINGCSDINRAEIQKNNMMANESQKKANDNAFKTVEQQQTQLKADAAQLQNLQSNAQGATGQMQALGFANQLASNQATQLMQIRSLLMSQQQVLAAQAQAQTTKTAQEDASREVVRNTDFFQKSSSSGGLIQ